MYAWTDTTVREALGLRAELAESGVSFTEVCTDSRAVAAGALYVALVGERFDGHDFVAEAISKGAAGAVVQRPAPGSDDTRLYAVDDTLIALGALAAYRRRALEAPVVAVTGSSGKTTTKDFTAAALGSSIKVHATQGNLNNRIGMPLTLLAAPADAEAIVLELGTNEPGEIAALAKVARPDIAVITTVGESHLEKLGSVAGVMSEKLDLLRYLAEGARCVVGDEPPELAERARALASRVRVAGWSAKADEDLRPEEAERDVFGRYEFRWRGAKVVAPMAGRHAVSNTLVALAVAELLGVAPRDAARGLASATTASMRGELERIGSLTLIVDCYNANPQSVRASMDVLEHHSGVAERVAVLGSMLELGEASDALHRRVLEEVVSRNVDLIVATGEFAGAAESLGLDAQPNVLTATDWRSGYPALRGRLRGNEVVLLKASRGVAMEGLIELFRRDFADEAVEA